MVVHLHAHLKWGGCCGKGGKGEDYREKKCLTLLHVSKMKTLSYYKHINVFKFPF